MCFCPSHASLPCRHTRPQLYDWISNSEQDSRYLLKPQFTSMHTVTLSLCCCTPWRHQPLLEPSVFHKGWWRCCLCRVWTCPSVTVKVSGGCAGWISRESYFAKWKAWRDSIRLTIKTNWVYWTWNKNSSPKGIYRGESRVGWGQVKEKRPHYVLEWITNIAGL